MYILGISAFYHDSAAVIVKDGDVVCAIEEERLSRIKHDNAFPFLAIQKCLDTVGIKIEKIDAIAYYEKPLLKFERILENIVKDYPFSLKLFFKAIPEWLGQKIKVEEIIKKKLKFKGQIYYIPHHLSHAAASFYPSPFKNSAILTIDGVGEYQTTGLWVGEKNKITFLKSLNYPNSVGLLFSVFTSYLGFKVNEDEYKVMGLAAYGKPLYKEQVYKLLDLKEDGSFRLHSDYFNFENYSSPWNQAFEDLFGSPRRINEGVLIRHKNIAASIQEVTEELYFKILNHLHSEVKQKDLCVGGGVGLNALANGKIYSKTPFKKVYVFGAAGDNGGALGAALLAYHSIYKQSARNQISNLNLGTAYSSEGFENIFNSKKVIYKKLVNKKELVETTARLLAKGHIVGWFQGRMEFGPRALGGRSILANPKEQSMKSKVNNVKFREQFRPFAGSVLQEKVHKLFQVPEKNHYSPFMTFCFPVREEQRSNLGAITHKDRTCRIQTVAKEDGLYYELIKSFEKITAIPCILNTSFNLKGEPIVETPEQAVNDFIKSKMDYLVLENYLLEKSSFI